MSALNVASRFKFLSLVLWIFLFLFLLTYETAKAGNISKLKELNVSYWLEYDQPSVLIIYRGKLSDDVRLPARVKLLVPEAAKISSTAEIDESGQFKYDYAWPTHTVVSSADFKELSFETRYPTFQAEVYWPINLSPTRSFNLQLKIPLAVENLGVEIQEPLKATNFKLEPKAAEVSSDGTFNYHRYSFSSQSAEKEFVFKVVYEKSNNEPSLGNQLPTQGITNDASNRSTLLFWLFFALSLLITAIGASFFRLRYASAPLRKQKVVFCSQCGQRLEKKYKFCINCGRPVK